MRSSKALTILDQLSDDEIDRPEAAEYYDARRRRRWAILLLLMGNL